MIRWIFFDIGNVVMNDDPVMAFIYEELHQAIIATGRDLPFERLLKEREASIEEAGPGHWYRLGERYLGSDGIHSLMHRCAGIIREDYMAFHNVIPGMKETLGDLSGSFSLGVIANQLKEVVIGLEVSGLRQCFRVLALSELIGVKKPDQEIFRWAIREAGCLPEEAVMVGDRVDNDIAPAASAGLWTIWFHMPVEEKGYSPSESRRRLHFESQKRVSIAGIGPSRPEEIPDGEATSPQMLKREVYRLFSLSHERGPGSPKV